MSKIPSDGNGQNIDKQLLRIGLISELDAINLYEQMAELATDDDIKNILLDIAKEEKTHVGEFQKLLEIGDKETKEELEAGAEEVEVADEDGDLKEARKRLHGLSPEGQLTEMKNMFVRLGITLIK
jgi:rubrerythrin